MTLSIGPFVRAANIDDAREIARVHVHAWQKAYQGVLNRHFLRSMEIAKVMAGWEEQLAIDCQNVQVVDNGAGRVIAWATWGRPRDVDVTSDCAEIYGFYCDPKFWGKGPATMLMNEVLAQLTEKRYANVILWTLEANPRARRFYAKHSFLPDGKRKLFVHVAGRAEQIRYAREL